MNSNWQKLINKINSKKACLLITDRIDDQIVFVEAMSDVAPGTLVLLAESSHDAFDLLKKSAVVPHCIFLELHMSGAEGFSFLRNVKAIRRLQHIPIIVRVDQTSFYMVPQLKEIGVWGIYVQPFRYEGVCNALHVFFNKFHFSLN